MRIKWWGHACFEITAGDGTAVITDPYDEEVGYARITASPDVVTVSHDHYDHNATDTLSGNPVVVDGPGLHSAAGVSILGLDSYHDTRQGRDRGENLIFVMELDGIKVCHLGDLGHMLTQSQVEKLEVDLLLVPVGGTFTIDAREAREVVERLNPSAVIPMHYGTADLSFELSGVEPFLRQFDEDRIVHMESEEMEVTPLPERQTVYVLNYEGQ